LLQLGCLLGETRYLDAAERTIRAAWSHILQMPDAHGTVLLAVESLLFEPHIVILRGTAEKLALWQAECLRSYSPRKLCFAIPETAVLPEVLASKVLQGDIVAYHCTGMQCSAPIMSLEELHQLMA